MTGASNEAPKEGVESGVEVPTRVHVVHAQQARTGALSTPSSPWAATSPSSADHLFRRTVCVRTGIPTCSIVSR